jgi:hypothetical protein
MKIIEIKIANIISGATLIPASQPIQDITCIIRYKADVGGISKMQPFISVKTVFTR